MNSGFMVINSDVAGDWNFCLVCQRLRMSSSQLTNSYFSEGLIISFLNETTACLMNILYVNMENKFAMNDKSPALIDMYGKSSMNGAFSDDDGFPTIHSSTGMSEAAAMVALVKKNGA